MELLSNGITINLICEDNHIPPNRVPIIFLHGFTGSAKDWIFLFDKLSEKYFPIAIDLPGHGKTITPNNLDSYSSKSYVDVVNSIFKKLKIERAIIVGYSMGGRAALSFAIENHDKVIALILESSTAGIEKESERISRTKIDSDIATKIISGGINSFVNYWMELPFFESLKLLDNKTYSKIIADKKTNSQSGLSNSLKGFSTGIMPSQWHKLDVLDFPTLLIAGELDRKYVRINREMSSKIKNSYVHVFPKCGHNTHLENPEEFVILVNKFLNNLENNETQLAKS